jgi:cell division protein FtsB
LAFRQGPFKGFLPTLAEASTRLAKKLVLALILSTFSLHHLRFSYKIAPGENWGRLEVKSAAAPGGNGKAKFSTKSVAIATLGLVFVLVILVFFSHRGLFKIYHLRLEKNRLETENRRLAEENDKLAKTIDRLHNDPQMIQDLIRRELNFVKKNEIIVQLPTPKKDDLVKAVIVPDRPPPVTIEGTDKKRPRARLRAVPGPRKTTQ